MLEVNEIIKIAKKVCLENDSDLKIDEDSCFIGGESSLDSMTLVQLCIALEEESNLLDFDFDWTSEKAMSSMNSIFRSPKSLTDEFNRQYKKSREK